MRTASRQAERSIKVRNIDRGIMSVVIDTGLLKQTIGVTTILSFKFVVCIMIQGHARIIGGSRPPEDAVLFPKAGVQTFDGSEKFKADDEKGKLAKEREARWLRLIHNDLENIPLGLIIAWGSLLCNPNTKAASAFLWLFCAGRLGHTVAYANALQPARAYGWMAGVAGFLGMSVTALVGALTM